MTKPGLSPFLDIAAAIQNLIEVVQENEDRMAPPKLAALQRARRYRAELMVWVDSQRD